MGLLRNECGVADLGMEGCGCHGDGARVGRVDGLSERCRGEVVRVAVVGGGHAGASLIHRRRLKAMAAMRT